MASVRPSPKTSTPVLNVTSANRSPGFSDLRQNRTASRALAMRFSSCMLPLVSITKQTSFGITFSCPTSTLGEIISAK